MDKQLWKFTDYQSKEGAKALSIELHITDMPCGYAPPFPANLRAEANRASAILGDVFAEIAERQRLKRNLVTGNQLDPKKRHAVAAGLRCGDFDAQVIKPYMRKTTTLELPGIVVVASAGVSEVNADSTYLGRICALALTIGWACEAVGAEVRTVLMEGMSKYRLSDKQPYREVQLAYTLLEPGTFTNLQSYAVGMSRNYFYGSGFQIAYDSDKNCRRRSAKLENAKSVPWHRAFLSNNAGEGVHWAHSMYHPDIVIAVGALTDAADADIRLSTNFKLDQAVAEIAKQARALIR